MKKALVALLALAVTGALIAQDAPSLKFSGYLNSGVQYNFGAATDPGQFNAYADDAGVAGYRMNLDGTYVNGNVGANFRLRSDSGAAYAMNFGYVWANLASNMVKVKAGLVDDGSWCTNGDIGSDVGEGTGVLVLVMPMDGLNFGAGMYDASTAYAGDKLENATYTMGFAYTMANTFAVQSSYNVVGGNGNTIYAGLDLLMVPMLGAHLEGKFTNVSDFSNTGLSTIAETLSYDMSPIKVGLVAYQWLSQKSGADIGYKVNPWVSYNSGIFTPKLSVTYDSNDSAARTKDTYSFTVKPSVGIAVGPNASINASYAYTANKAMTGLQGQTTPVIGDNAQQRLDVDFLWTF